MKPLRKLSVGWVWCGTTWLIRTDSWPQPHMVYANAWSYIHLTEANVWKKNPKRDGNSANYTSTTFVLHLFSCCSMSKYYHSSLCFFYTLFLNYRNILITNNIPFCIWNRYFKHLYSKHSPSLLISCDCNPEFNWTSLISLWFAEINCWWQNLLPTFWAKMFYYLFRQTFQQVLSEDTHATVEAELFSSRVVLQVLQTASGALHVLLHPPELGLPCPVDPL